MAACTLPSTDDVADLGAIRRRLVRTVTDPEMTLAHISASVRKRPSPQKQWSFHMPVGSSRKNEARP
jgi:hypothetical protein